MQGSDTADDGTGVIGYADTEVVEPRSGGYFEEDV